MLPLNTKRPTHPFVEINPLDKAGIEKDDSTAGESGSEQPTAANLSTRMKGSTKRGRKACKAAIEEAFKLTAFKSKKTGMRKPRAVGPKRGRGAGSSSGKRKSSSKLLRHWLNLRRDRKKQDQWREREEIKHEHSLKVEREKHKAIRLRNKAKGVLHGNSKEAKAKKQAASVSNPANLTDKQREINRNDREHVKGYHEWKARVNHPDKSLADHAKKQMEFHKKRIMDRKNLEEGLLNTIVRYGLARRRDKKQQEMWKERNATRQAQRKKLKEEVEQIDEVSKKYLKRYVNRASKDVHRNEDKYAHAATEEQEGEENFDDKWTMRRWAKKKETAAARIKKRTRGIKMANKKILKKSGWFQREETLNEGKLKGYYHSVFYKSKEPGDTWRHHTDCDDLQDAKDERQGCKDYHGEKAIIIKVPKAEADWRKVDIHNFVETHLNKKNKKAVKEEVSMDRKTLLEKVGPLLAAHRARNAAARNAASSEKNPEKKPDTSSSKGLDTSRISDWKKKEEARKEGEKKAHVSKIAAGMSAAGKDKDKKDKAFEASKKLSSGLHKAGRDATRSAVKAKVEARNKTREFTSKMSANTKKEVKHDRVASGMSAAGAVKKKPGLLKRMLRKEGVEQIDEISAKTLRSYVKKADADIHKRIDRADEFEMRGLDKVANKVGNKAFDRALHWERAHAKLGTRDSIAGGRGKKAMTDPATNKPPKVMAREEVGQIDEISKKLAGNYIRKAAADIDDKSDLQAMREYDININGDHMPKKEYEKVNKDYDKTQLKLVNRHNGIDRAVKKLTKEEAAPEAKPGYISTQTRTGPATTYIVEKFASQSEARANYVQRSRPKDAKLSLNETLAIMRKAETSGVSYEVLKEVYARGVQDWIDSKITDKTPSQHAFNRINSFIAEGAAAEIDKDLLVEKASKSFKKANKKEPVILKSTTNRQLAQIARRRKGSEIGRRAKAELERRKKAAAKPKKREIAAQLGLLAIGKKRKLDLQTVGHLKHIHPRTIAIEVKKTVAKHQAEAPLKKLQRKLAKKEAALTKAIEAKQALERERNSVERKLKKTAKKIPKSEAPTIPKLDPVHHVWSYYKAPYSFEYFKRELEAGRLGPEWYDRIKKHSKE